MQNCNVCKRSPADATWPTWHDPRNGSCTERIIGRCSSCQQLVKGSVGSFQASWNEHNKICSTSTVAPLPPSRKYLCMNIYGIPATHKPSHVAVQDYIGSWIGLNRLNTRIEGFPKSKESFYAFGDCVATITGDKMVVRLAYESSSEFSQGEAKKAFLFFNDGKAKELVFEDGSGRQKKEAHVLSCAWTILTKGNGDREIDPSLTTLTITGLNNDDEGACKEALSDECFFCPGFKESGLLRTLCITNSPVDVGMSIEAQFLTPEQCEHAKKTFFANLSCMWNESSRIKVNDTLYFIYDALKRNNVSLTEFLLHEKKFCAKSEIRKYYYLPKTYDPDRTLYVVQFSSEDAAKLVYDKVNKNQPSKWKCSYEPAGMQDQIDRANLEARTIHFKTTNLQTGEDTTWTIEEEIISFFGSNDVNMDKRTVTYSTARQARKACFDLDRTVNKSGDLVDATSLFFEDQTKAWGIMAPDREGRTYTGDDNTSISVFSEPRLRPDVYEFSEAQKFLISEDFFRFMSDKDKIECIKTPLAFQVCKLRKLNRNKAILQEGSPLNVKLNAVLELICTQDSRDPRNSLSEQLFVEELLEMLTIDMLLENKIKMAEGRLNFSLSDTNSTPTAGGGGTRQP